MKYKCMVMNKVRKMRIKNDKFILARKETMEMMRCGLERKTSTTIEIVL
jgi:hypothetical protein